MAVADITRHESLTELDDWIDSTLQVVGRIPVLVAVNKIDLEEEVAYGEREISQVARAFNAPHILTSAKSSENVDDAFEQLGSMVVDHHLGVESA